MRKTQPMDAIISQYGMNESLEILYRDEYLVAVNKPAGLLVHRSSVDRREKQVALQMIRNQIGLRVYPVHRLDRPTSGVLLFALSPEISRTVSEHFRNQHVKKRYIAVVRGYIPESGRIDHPVKEVKDRYLQSQPLGREKSYSAITVFNRLATVELSLQVDKYPTTRYSLVELFPLTGKRHQLRYHMKHVSHPIIGDSKYGKSTHNQFFREQFECNQLLLCAKELTIPHPVTCQKLKVVAPFSPLFHKIVLKFQWNRKQ